MGNFYLYPEASIGDESTHQGAISQPLSFLLFFFLLCFPVPFFFFWLTKVLLLGKSAAEEGEGERDTERHRETEDAADSGVRGASPPPTQRVRSTRGVTQKVSGG